MRCAGSWPSLPAWAAAAITITQFPLLSYGRYYTKRAVAVTEGGYVPGTTVQRVAQGIKRS